MDNTNFENYLRKYVEGDNIDDPNDHNDGGDGSILSESLSRVINNCKYYDIDDILDIIPKGNIFKYSSIHINIHSLPSKHDQLISLLSKLHDIDLKINFVMLCETFLNDVNFDKFPIPGFQFVQTNRTNRKGGGVGIYIRDELQFIQRPDLALNIESEFESIFVEVTNLPQKLIVGEIYRIPNTNEQLSIDRYETILQQLTAFNGDIIIGTDQNFNYINTSTHNNTSQLLNTFITAGFIPTITKPTRITQFTSTLIDNIYIKSKSHQNLYSGILNTQISDHLPIFMFIGKQPAQQRQSSTITYRPMDDVIINLIHLHLINTNWEIMDDMNTDQATEYVTAKITDTLNLCAPEKTIKLSYKKKLRQPWMTTGLLKSSKTKDKLFKNFLRKPKDTCILNKYTHYRNRYNKLKRISKQNYYAAQLNKYKCDSKNTWSVLNNLIGKHNNKSTMSDRFEIDNKKLINDPKYISNEFCKYFSEVGNKFASKIPNPKTPYNHYLNQRNYSSFFMTPTDPEEIHKTIISLKPKNSSGYDNISSKLLKNIVLSIKYPLCIIVNKSLETGKVPNSLKLAKIIPIFKAKDKILMSNNRPISFPFSHQFLKF